MGERRPQSFFKTWRAVCAVPPRRIKQNARAASPARGAPGPFRGVADNRDAAPPPHPRELDIGRGGDRQDANSAGPTAPYAATSGKGRDAGTAAPRCNPPLTRGGCGAPPPAALGPPGNMRTTKFRARRSMGVGGRPWSSVPVGLTLKCVRGGLTAMRSSTLCNAPLALHQMSPHPAEKVAVSNTDCGSRNRVASPPRCPNY
ncbi:hypothetical protein NDU88_011068 [Pleurodeles waltl]|uniref:Uncharacterized protein n=1 Tax=Pleurodeles waltl TaxID=8319 RepID=A0AAV7PXL3_PLEWA|nr:hypothetical protein NDU88_011068 [Pleurodeles waltl]